MGFALKAPKILLLVWLLPKPRWLKVNTDVAAQGCLNLAVVSYVQVGDLIKDILQFLWIFVMLIRVNS